jgi:hypothetical protein
MKKGQILLLYITLFIIFLELYINNVKILNHKVYEIINMSKIDEYSIIESEIIMKIVEMFHEYKMEDFVQDSKLGIINVYFIDESAYIKFNYENLIYARLDYDLVYDSCYNYDIISEALFPIVDKKKS